MAKNAPYGDNHRHGAVKDREQVHNPHNNKYALSSNEVKEVLLIGE